MVFPYSVVRFSLEPILQPECICEYPSAVSTITITGPYWYTQDTDTLHTLI